MGLRATDEACSYEYRMRILNCGTATMDDSLEEGGCPLEIVFRNI